MNQIQNATVRARKLGKLIRNEVAAGNFKVDSGYLAESSLTRKCYGCALAAAAYALGTRPKPEDSYLGREELLDTVSACPTVKISRREAAQLEMGFEQWGSVYTWSEPNETGNHMLVKSDTRNPFYRLGARLRVERDKARAAAARTRARRS
jgi:hypothetical protein